MSKSSRDKRFFKIGMFFCDSDVINTNITEQETLDTVYFSILLTASSLIMQMQMQSLVNIVFSKQIYALIVFLNCRLTEKNRFVSLGVFNNFQ